MSRTTISRYRDLEAERRRAEQRELRKLKRELERLESLGRRLSELQEYDGVEFSGRLRRLSDQSSSLTAGERAAWLLDVNREIERIEVSITAAHEQRLRLALTARSLMTGPTDMQKRLAKIAQTVRGSNLKAFEALRDEVESIVTARILSAEKGQSKSSLGADELAMAAQLMGPVHRNTKFAVGETEADPRLARFLKTIARFGDAAGELERRAESLFGDAPGAEFQLKLDSLFLDAASLRESQQLKLEMQEKREEALDRLAPFDDPAATSLRVQLEECERYSIDQQRRLIDEAMVLSDTLSASHDAKRARVAILAGLQELGYEVSQAEDEWNVGDRITAKMSDEPNYDIQLAAAADGRVQTKVRAYQHSGRSSGVNERDLEVEERWCSDLREIHDRLQTDALGVWLEHEDAPGAQVPVPISRTHNDSERTTIPSGKAKQART